MCALFTNYIPGNPPVVLWVYVSNNVSRQTRNQKKHFWRAHVICNYKQNFMLEESFTFRRILCLMNS